MATGTVCLLMMVRNEGAVIERCLSSVRPFIDHWIIADTGSEDDTAKRVELALADIPGKLVTVPFTDFADVRNQLLDLSRGKADTVLWIDADETVTVVGEDLPRPAQGGALLVEVETSRGCYLQPRLVAADARYVFTGALAEHTVGLHNALACENLTIVHHEDGTRWRDAAKAQRDCLLFEEALLVAPREPALLLPHAEALAEKGEWFLAANQFRACSLTDLDEPERWYATYQAARMLDKADVSVNEVVDAYHRAFDLNPSKIEPLVRIAHRLRLSGQFESALEIINVALQQTEPHRQNFYEPELWLESRYIEYIKVNLALQRGDVALQCAEQQLSEGYQRAGFVRELSRLREDILEGSLAAAPLPANHKSAAIEEPTPPGEHRKLCIGMATFDDYDGVYFTIQSIRLYHPEVLDDVEFLVIDNNPTGAAASALKSLETSISNYRYVPQGEATGTVCKDYIFREANAEYVMIMDCHVLVAPGAIKALLDYFDEHPDTSDLLQGPLVYDNLNSMATHFAPGWSGGMWGKWDLDPRGNDARGAPFEIDMQGCGLLACRRAAWQGFNPRFRGFGAEERYIQEKFRQAGGQTLCLPFLRWLHRFNRPLGVPYAVNWYDRVRNYIIGWTELGLNLDSAREHFDELLGSAQTQSIFSTVERELAGALYGYDVIVHAPVSPAFDDDFRLSQLSIDTRVMRVSDDVASDTPARLRWFAQFLRALAQSTCQHCLIIQDLAPMEGDYLEAARETLAQLGQGEVVQVVLPGSQENAENIAVHRDGFEDLADALEGVAQNSSVAA